MVALAALLTTVALQTAPLEADRNGAPPAQDATEAEASEGGTPREVVARLIQDAMGRPDSAATWRQLAEALPRMAAGAGPDPALVRAASIADATADMAEVSATVPDSAEAIEPATAIVPVGPNPRPSGALSAVGPAPSEPADRRLGVVAATASVASRTVDGLLARADRFSVEARLAFGGLSLLAALAFGLGRKTREPRRRTPPLVLPAAGASRKTPGGSALWTVRHLAESGASLAEIAQKTGMAQDTLNFILSPAVKSDAAPDPSAGSATARGFLATSASGKRTSAGVPTSRFRDGRLTY